MAKKSEIPFGAQFSPNQVNLAKLLHILHENASDRLKLTDAIRDEFFSAHPSSQRGKLGSILSFV